MCLHKVSTTENIEIIRIQTQAIRLPFRCFHINYREDNWLGDGHRKRRELGG